MEELIEASDDLIFGDGPITLGKVDDLIFKYQAEKSQLDVALQYLNNLRDRILFGRESLSKDHSLTLLETPPGESIRERLNRLVKSYPSRTIGSWVLFIREDGFLPSADNLLLVCSVLARETHISDRCYISIVGGECLRYRWGDEGPCLNPETFLVTKMWAASATDVQIMDLVGDAFDRLLNFVRKSEGL